MSSELTVGHMMKSAAETNLRAAFINQDAANQFHLTVMHGLDALSGIVQRLEQIQLDRPYEPNWVSPPGDTMLDIMAEKKIGRPDLVVASGLSEPVVDGLVAGSEPITPAIAQKLSEILGSTSEFWLKRDEQYRAHLGKRRTM